MDASWLADDCYYVDKRQQVSKIMGYLRGDRSDIPIVEDNGRPYAVVDPRAAMRRGLRNDMNIEKVAWPVATVQNGDTTESVLRRFATSGSYQLPAYLGRPPRKAGFVDAGAFLRNAFDEGPGAAYAAQGVPPLWPDATVEDAIQAFAASALPYLPVLGKGVEGVVRREAVMPYLEDNAGMGRKDLAGGRNGVRNESIEALIEPFAPVLRGGAKFDEVLDALAEQPCWFIDNGLEAVTAVSMLQAIHTIKTPSPVATHFRQG